jgi:hypothetical protein
VKRALPPRLRNTKTCQEGVRPRCWSCTEKAEEPFQVHDEDTSSRGLRIGDS